MTNLYKNLTNLTDDSYYFRYVNQYVNVERIQNEGDKLTYY